MLENRSPAAESMNKEIRARLEGNEHFQALGKVSCDVSLCTAYSMIIQRLGE